MRLVMSSEHSWHHYLAAANVKAIVDDGNGSFVLPVSKTLKYDLVNRKRPAHVETSLPEFSKANGERYVTIADRKKQAKTKVKRHRYPDLSVGDIVRIRGRMKEWSRRNGEVIREVVVDQDGGSLSESGRVVDGGG